MKVDETFMRKFEFIRKCLENKLMYINGIRISIIGFDDWKRLNVYDKFILMFVDGDENKLVERVMSMIDEVYEKLIVDDNVMVREVYPDNRKLYKA